MKNLLCLLIFTISLFFPNEFGKVVSTDELDLELRLGPPNVHVNKDVHANSSTKAIQAEKDRSQKSNEKGRYKRYHHEVVKKHKDRMANQLQADPPQQLAQQSEQKGTKRKVMDDAVVSAALARWEVEKERERKRAKLKRDQLKVEGGPALEAYKARKQRNMKAFREKLTKDPIAYHQYRQTQNKSGRKHYAKVKQDKEKWQEKLSQGREQYANRKKKKARQSQEVNA